MIVLPFVFLCVFAVRGELYSALAGMETLLDTQRVIIHTMDEHIQSMERRLGTLKKCGRVGALKACIKFPIEQKQNFSELTTFHSVVLPDENDLDGAAKALLRVQQTYGLKTSELAEGKIFGVTRVLSLTEGDCFELGRQAYHNGFYESALSWLELAKNMSLANAEDANSMPEIQRYLKAAEMEKDRSDFMVFASNLFQLGLMSMNSLEDPNHTRTMTDVALSKNIFMGQANFFDEATYKQLCQSSMRDVAASPSSVLRCRLVSSHPYLVLQPVKEEELWAEPKIALYHGVISDREMDTMKEMARPQLKRAEVAEYTSSLGHRVSDTRVTKIAWLKRGDHPLIPELYARIESVTGLSSVSAEPFQMANYGLGGHFHLHMDVLPDTETYFGPDMGNRVATWMYYMSDVNGGGATVFPRLNITVWPKKGSALFWHNINSNGIGNILTLHGACPVVSGSKWVTNVWYHERGQEFRLKCGKHPDSALLQTNSFKLS
ncbi:hypothetical protein JTE90_017369 [Oedothorax gibbosus]|uniref:procollagen-proline 4-dioxygenase n=1 Tax=Oedothorax gibbosus TaxID=931172 RepID=A0AAV6VR10_9ARAC|nr:hypothetical protein JTE90_017369 [Oedothorax gibbosus]